MTALREVRLNWARSLRQSTLPTTRCRKHHAGTSGLPRGLPPLACANFVVARRAPAEMDVKPK